MKSEHAQTASAIRKELKQIIPGIKFSVISKSFSGGNSVTVFYPEEFSDLKMLRIILSKYKKGNFNGKEDIYEYSNKNDNLPQVKFVHCARISNKNKFEW